MRGEKDLCSVSITYQIMCGIKKKKANRPKDNAFGDISFKKSSDLIKLLNCTPIFALLISVIKSFSASWPLHVFALESSQREKLLQNQGYLCVSKQVLH